jgi:hypothetical protein
LFFFRCSLSSLRMKIQVLWITCIIHTQMRLKFLCPKTYGDTRLPNFRHHIVMYRGTTYFLKHSLYYLYVYIYTYGRLIQFIANLGFYKIQIQEVLSCPKICQALQDIDKKPVLIREMIFLKVLYKDAMRSGERSLKGPSMLCLMQVVIWCNMGISEVMVDPQSSPVNLY